MQHPDLLKKKFQRSPKKIDETLPTPVRAGHQCSFTIRLSSGTVCVDTDYRAVERSLGYACGSLLGSAFILGLRCFFAMTSPVFKMLVPAGPVDPSNLETQPMPTGLGRQKPSIPEIQPPDCLRKVLEWNVANPPPPLDPRLQYKPQFKQVLERVKLKKAARLGARFQHAYQVPSQHPETNLCSLQGLQCVDDSEAGNAGCRDAASWPVTACGCLQGQGARAVPRYHVALGCDLSLELRLRGASMVPPIDMVYR